MNNTRNRTAILVSGYWGQPNCTELERLAAAGEAPRTDYVELARMLDADVIDGHYMAERAAPLARIIASRVGMMAGQIAEVFLRRGCYRHILVWGERLGFPVALLFKLAHARHDLVLILYCASTPRRAVFLQRFKVHSHLRAISNESSMQMEIAAQQLGVPQDKLYLNLPGSDERFWHPDNGPTENLICSVGSEARDYPTLVKAAQGLDLEVELVVGGGGPVAALLREIGDIHLPPNIRVRNKLSWPELRRLYSRSRFVVVPTQDVEFNAGITVVREAMVMGKAVIVTRSRGQVDYVRDGEHGIHVPPGDSLALRAAIEYLINHPQEAERMGRAGRALMEECYTLDIYVARLAAIMRGDAAHIPDVPQARLVDTPARPRGSAVLDGLHR